MSANIGKFRTKIVVLKGSKYIKFLVIHNISDDILIFILSRRITKGPLTGGSKY